MGDERLWRLTTHSYHWRLQGLNTWIGPQTTNVSHGLLWASIQSWSERKVVPISRLYHSVLRKPKVV